MYKVKVLIYIYIYTLHNIISVTIKTKIAMTRKNKFKKVLNVCQSQQ